MYDGRTLDQKRELVKGITEVVARVTGNAPDVVHVLIEEVRREHWANGRLLAPDRAARAQATATTP
jgi:4-oxalocrotonate tautomerase